MEVYKLAFKAAMKIFEVTKRFPPEERYSLTDQIRRSSRSVCGAIAEGWRRRRYIAIFRSKLSEAAQEAAETQMWLDFARACGYLSEEDYVDLDETYEHIFAMVATMEDKAESFCRSAK